MREQELGGKRPAFDYDRYRQLLADADNEEKRSALIKLLIEERARDRLYVQATSDREGRTASTVANVLKASRSA